MTPARKPAESLPATSRARFRDIPAILDVLRIHLKSPGYVQYAEDMDKSPVIGSQILGMKPLVVAFWNDCSATLVQDDVEKALKMLYTEKQAAAVSRWAIPSGEIDDWCKTTARRIRTMLRHVSQARLKSASAEWLISLNIPAVHKLAFKKPAAASKEAVDDLGEVEGAGDGEEH